MGVNAVRLPYAGGLLVPGLDCSVHVYVTGGRERGDTGMEPCHLSNRVYAKRLYVRFLTDDMCRDVERARACSTL